MDTEQMQKIEESLTALDGLRNQLCRTLRGQQLTARSLAGAMEPYLPELPQKELEQICRALSSGIERGIAAFRSISSVPAGEAGTWITERLHEMLEPLSDEEKRRYLLLFYQILSQEFDRKVSAREAVFLSNLSVQDLEQEVSQLAEGENKKLAADAIDCLCDYMETQEDTASLETSPYTEAENIWLTSAALYIYAQGGVFKGLPAEYIGQQAGLFQSFLSKLKNAKPQEVISSAMGLLAMAAASCLVYGLFAFLVTCPQFAPVISYVTGMPNWKTLQMSGLAAVAKQIGNLGGLVYSKTLQLTSHAFAERTAGTLNDHYIDLQQRIGRQEPEALSEPAEGLETAADGVWADGPDIWQPSSEQEEGQIKI